jgi:hypothetical protein
MQAVARRADLVRAFTGDGLSNLSSTAAMTAMYRLYATGTRYISPTVMETASAAWR